MTKRQYKVLQNLLLLFTILVLWSAFYLQLVKGLQPCPLCLMQRACAILLGLFCLMGLCLSTRSRARMVAVFQMVVALAGLFFSLRQLWLQSLPAGDVPSCLPGLDVLLHYFPWRDVFLALFWGSGECAENTWRLLGFSMPAWSAFYFLVMFLLSTIIFIQLNRALARFDKL